MNSEYAPASQLTDGGTRCRTHRRQRKTPILFLGGGTKNEDASEPPTHTDAERRQWRNQRQTSSFSCSWACSTLQWRPPTEPKSQLLRLVQVRVPELQAHWALWTGREVSFSTHTQQHSTFVCSHLLCPQQQFLFGPVFFSVLCRYTLREDGSLKDCSAAVSGKEPHSRVTLLCDI